MLFRCLHALLLVIFLSACSGAQVYDYSDRQPVFSAERFFSGKLTAHGVVKDRGGRVIRSFNADIVAYWKEGVGTLEEDFVFDDGEKQRRIWTLTPSGEGSYIGTAGDVVGDGTMAVSGNSAFLDYVLRIPYKGTTLDVHVDDRMYLLSDNILLNESTLSKFGVRVASLLLVITKTLD